MRLANRGVALNRQLAAKIEQVVLDVNQKLAKLIRQRLRQQQSDHAIQFVDFADRSNPRMRFRYARTIAETSGATVAGFVVILESRWPIAQLLLARQWM